MHSDGSPNINALNVISGVYAMHFVDAFWMQSNENAETCGVFMSLFRSLMEDGENNKAIQLIMLLFGIVGCIVPQEFTLIASDQDALSAFLAEFLLDLEDIFEELPEDM